MRTKLKKIVVVLMAITVVMILAMYSMGATRPQPYNYFSEEYWTEDMKSAHRAADILRENGYGNDSQEIMALSKIWYDGRGSLFILAKTIQYEAGKNETELMGYVGAVVMNRVRSDEFPDTVFDVVMQPRQYSSIYRSDVPEDTAAQREREGRGVAGIGEIRSVGHPEAHRPHGLALSCLEGKRLCLVSPCPPCLGRRRRNRCRGGICAGRIPA